MEYILPIYELFKSTETVVPFGQVLLYVFIVSIFMLLRRLKFGLIATYIFVFYWGFVLNKGSFMSAFGEVEYGIYVYGFCGFLVLLLAIYSFFFKE